MRHFRVSHDPWIVTVNMVSEGVDIRRLRVVVYLTSRLTQLAFRQIFGRVVRTDPPNSRSRARLLPSGPPPRQHGQALLTQDVDLLPAPIVIVIDQDPARIRIEGDNDGLVVPFETLQTVGEQGNVFDTYGHQADAALVACARLFIERERLTGTDPESLAIAAADNPELRGALLVLREDL